MVNNMEKEYILTLKVYLKRRRMVRRFFKKFVIKKNREILIIYESRKSTQLKKQ